MNVLQPKCTAINQFFFYVAAKPVFFSRVCGKTKVYFDNQAHIPCVGHHQNREKKRWPNGTSDCTKSHRNSALQPDNHFHNIESTNPMFPTFPIPCSLSSIFRSANTRTPFRSKSVHTRRISSPSRPITFAELSAFSSSTTTAAPTLS